MADPEPVGTLPKRLARAPVADSCDKRLRSTPPTAGGGERAADNVGTGGGAGERTGTGGGTIAVGRIGGGEEETGRGFNAAS